MANYLGEGVFNSGTTSTFGGSGMLSNKQKQILTIFINTVNIVKMELNIIILLLILNTNILSSPQNY